MNLNDLFNEEKVRLDPKCWTGKKIGNPKTKMKGGTRVNNCVPAESVNEMDKSQTPPGRDGSTDSDAGKKEYTAKAITPKKAVKDGEKILNKVLNKKQGVAEGLNTGPQIIYATGPRTMGTNDVDLVFKDLRTGKIVAHVVGNNNSLQEFALPDGGEDGGNLPERPATYEIRMNNSKAPTYVAFGDPNQDSEYKVYKLGPKQPGAQAYYGMGITLVSNLDWWSFLEKMLGEIMAEDDAIESGLVDRKGDGDLVFVKQQGVAEEYELAGVGVAYELGRRAYKERKTARDNPYSATREARKNDEWAKGLERGKHDANDARHFRSSVREQAVAEGLAQDEAEEDSGWRAEFVNEINYNTFEVKLTNTRSKESANFIVRPVDMVSYGPTLSIETMDVHDLQTGQTESWTNDDPAPEGPIAYAISGLFYDDKRLQQKLQNIIDTHDTKGQDMMPGLEKRRSIGQEVDADTYVDSGEKTQAAMAKMKKGVAEKLGDNRPKLGSKRDAGKSVRKWRKSRGLDETGVAEGLAQDPSQPYLDKLGARAGAAPGSNITQVTDAYQQKLLDRMGKRFGLPPGSSMEQVQAAQQAHLDKNDPAAAAQYKQNMANIDADNSAANKPVTLAQPAAQTPAAAPAAPATPSLGADFDAGLAAQKAGGSPVDIMLAQPAIAGNQKLVDAIGSAYGLPPGSSVEQVKAAAAGKGKPAAPAQPAAPVAEGKPKEKEADYGDDYQDMVARMKKLAGLGPLKTVYDPAKRVYRNMPTAQQPKK